VERKRKTTGKGEGGMEKSSGRRKPTGAERDRIK